MLHLHGSVHFQMVSTQIDLHSIRWENDLSSIRSGDAYGRGPILSVEGSMFLNSVIVAGYGKSTQILRRPFITYYSELDRLVSTSDTLLCLGYGFGDVHLNLAFGAYRDDRHRPVVIVDWAEDADMSASATGLDGSYSPINRAMQLFSTGAHTMQAHDRMIPGTVRHIKENKGFDNSMNPDTPLAIWYNGMYAACENAGKIIDKLT